MKLIRAAGIDIGTNTILMVIGEKKPDGNLNIIIDEHSIARLGAGVDSSKNIRQEAIDRAIKILKSYRHLLDNNNITRVRIVATSALRDASNRSYVIEQLSKAIGSEIEIISGNEEAFLSFMGTVEGDELSTIIDIGGGSTEIITGAQGRIIAKQSLDIGTVRLSERMFAAHPPSENEINIFEKEVKFNLRKLSSGIETGKFYAVAGTPTTIAQVALGMQEYDFNKINGYVLDIDTVNTTISKFLDASVEEISDRYHIHPKRADIITAGAFILKFVMEYFRIDKATVSAKGLRYGVMLSVLNKSGQEDNA